MRNHLRADRKMASLLRAGTHLRIPSRETTMRHAATVTSVVTRAAASILFAGAAATTATADTTGAALPSTLTAPKVYVFPLTGQMGTDISPQLFDIIVEDIKKQKPDIVVMQLKSADKDRNDYLQNDDKMEFGMPQVEQYRDMVKKVHEELPKIPQIMWVEDSVGFATLIALGWPDLYMKSDARMSGLQGVAAMAQGWQDPDVAAKMLAAWTGIGKGILQQGGYRLELGDAMIFPEQTLSVNFDGRKVTWLLDTAGVWIVDSSKEVTAHFDATLAEDTGLADGIADSLDDLMFLLGYREFTQVESGPKLAKQYVEDWRRSMDRCVEWMADAKDVDSTVAGLGKAKTLYEKVLAAMKQFPALELRLGRMGIPSKGQLEIEIDNIKKEIQRAREAEKGNRGGGSGSGSTGRGLGGGGGLGGGKRGS